MVGVVTRLTVALEFAAAAATLAANRPLTCSLMLEGAASVTVTPSVDERARFSGGLYTSSLLEFFGGRPRRLFLPRNTNYTNYY